ncbi:hypothetical protein [Candidatus Spongiihabitans sp.]|uniref:hypothetical protein n=1 Tax=Candidatus Spongiihabitans sp. TaxID=3101308 RepID=UPI003C7B618D
MKIRAICGYFMIIVLGSRVKFPFAIHIWHNRARKNAGRKMMVVQQHQTFNSPFLRN